jgi:hypothetical protein
VQVPIRKGFESAVLSFLSGAQIWNSEGEFVIDDKIAPEYLSIAEEFKSQSGNNSVNDKGTLKVIKDSATVQGTKTEFSDADVNRQITIKGRPYIIKKVDNSTSIILRSKYVGEDDSQAGYAMGGILIGQPWEIKLPTSLVKLDSGELNLM